jgi:LPXTG-motif cell wall-anchored protein
MKKNNLYILIGLAAVGGFYFYMKKKKKGTVTVADAEKITEQQFDEFSQDGTQKIEPLQNLIQSVKKVTQVNKAKKEQKEKLKAATAFANYFGTKKPKVKKFKARKLGELSIFS